MKKTTSFHIICLIVLSLSGMALGQQEPQFVQFTDNLNYYNPAYSGSRDMLNVTAFSRNQWVGINGAPKTNAFLLNTPLKYENIGIGLNFLSDKIGPLSQTWFNASFSYALKINNKKSLRFGLSGGVNNFTSNLFNLSVTDPNDPDVQSNLVSVLKPNVGSGLYYSSDKFFAGVSVPKILQLRNNSYSYYKDQRHFYFMTGGYISFNRMLKYRPSAMLKITDNAPFSLDLSNSLIFYDKFWIGLNYKFSANVGVFAQFLIKDRLKVGYAFEVETTELMPHNYGSHEVMLSYDFNYLNKNIKNPRFF